MKQIYWCWLLLMLAGCSRNTAIQANRVSIAANQSKSLYDITITVQSIADSRCPVHVQCIRAGEAMVKVNIKYPGGMNTAEFCTGTDCRAFKIDDMEMVRVNGADYQVKLLEVNPFPGTGSANKQTALFSITKL